LKAEIEQRIQSLASLTTEAARSDAMRTFLEACASFYKYSPCNQLLIGIARPDASLVAGFTTWKRRERYVKKGEKGIPILAPCFHRETPDEENSPQVLGGFRVVFVFDVSQTDGQPLPPPPDWKSSARNEELQAKLTAFAVSRGVQVWTGDLRGETQGSSSGGRIELSPQAGTKTLIHEIAHELMHHGTDRREFTREEKELEAEAVAFVVGSHFGLPDLASSNYLALWDADERKILARMDRVRTTAAEIIRSIEPDNDPD
jgi:hypothetical protein